MAADGESAVTETAASAAAAPTKVQAVDACGRPVTFLEVIHEVEVSQQKSLMGGGKCTYYVDGYFDGARCRKTCLI